MKLTHRSSEKKVNGRNNNIDFSDPNIKIIALAGNPNTGKSTVFNSLTGLNQHTGNWAGKTVTHAKGSFYYRNQHYVLVDLPGTYSLLANSVEEQVARDFICFNQPHATIVVLDATCLERNLNLALQIMEITPHVIICINLLDEAQRKGYFIDLNSLNIQLGVPVVGTIAREGKGLEHLKDITYQVVNNLITPKPAKLIYSSDIERTLEKITPQLEKLLGERINARWVGLRLIDGDQSLLNAIYEHIDTFPELKKESEVLKHYGETKQSNILG